MQLKNQKVVKQKINNMLPELNNLKDQLKVINHAINNTVDNMVQLFCMAHPIVYEVHVRYNGDWGRDYTPDPVYYFTDEQKATEKASQERTKWEESNVPVYETSQPITNKIAYAFISSSTHLIPDSIQMDK